MSTKQSLTGQALETKFANVDSVQLRQIASSDSNVFRSAGFDELVELVRPIVQESCPKPTPPPTPGKWF